MDNTNDIIKVSVKVTNKGDVAGTEIVQLYVQAPQGELDKPQKELKAYAKTAILAPGESEVVVMNIDRNLLASFNPHHSAWIIDPGTYTILVGSSSRDIHLTAQFKIDEAEIVETVTPAFQEKHPFTELNPLKDTAVKH